MARPNLDLQRLRESTPSRIEPGAYMGRAELADAVNEYLWRVHRKRRDLTAHTIARYERGAVGWPGADYREALRAVLGVTSDSALGFAPTPRGRIIESVPAPEVPAVAFDLFTPTITDPVAFLALPRCVGAGRRIGVTEIEQIRTATRRAATAENTFGGTRAAGSADEDLGAALALVRSPIAAKQRGALFEAIGNLAGVHAFAAFDASNHVVADRYFTFALWCAGEARSWELRANTLADMARKASFVGNHDLALSLIELAQVRSDRISSTARAMISTMRAQTLSMLGRTSEAMSDVARADEHFVDRRPDTDSPWLCYYDEAEHLGSTGKALIPVAHARGRIELAAPRITQAIRLQHENYPRSRTFSRIRLATLTMRLGDPCHAASIAATALEEARAIDSDRLTAELGTLARAAAPHRAIREVAVVCRELRSLTRSDR